MRKISKDININLKTVRNIAKIKRSSKPYKQHTAKLIPNKNKNIQIHRSLNVFFWFVVDR